MERQFASLFLDGVAFKRRCSLLWHLKERCLVAVQLIIFDVLPGGRLVDAAAQLSRHKQ